MSVLLTTMRAAKDELRREMRERRLAVAPLEASVAAIRAARAFVSLAGPDPTIRTVAVYAAVRGELDPAPIARELRARRVAVCYPRMVPGTRLLAFHRVDDEAALVANRCGIPEPRADAPRVELAEVDVFVVPGLAFDVAGGRVGWGRAYYDATLAAAPRALRAGHLFQFQLVPRVPRTDGDEPVDYLVTDAGLRETATRATATLRRAR